ncbi:MAG: serine/threonine protein phosphatase [Acidaminococcaceae bacterium]|nr:serine/threonine protein phosphatase [Acidaminococcaceae bacterium]
MEYKRILAVGDVHGMYEKLITLMKKIQFNPAEDLLIFLGDYIDRGSQPLECLDYVKALSITHPGRVVPLIGNHEVMCLNYYRYKEQSRSFMMDGLDYEMAHVWLDNGGDKTKRQFKKLKRPELQKRLRWMRMLSNHYQVDKFYFCHAGIQPFIPLDRQREGDLLWMREGFFELYDGRVGTIVIGHTPVQELKRKHWTDGQPPTTPQFLDNNIIMCDTGTFMEGGKLSCVDVLTGKFWQA